MSLSYQSLLGITDVSADVISTSNLVANTITDTGLTANQIVVSDSNKALKSQALTNGQILIGNTSTNSFNVSTLTAGSTNQKITNSTGSISLDISHTPTFTTVNTGAITTAQITFFGAANSILTTNGFSDVQGVSLTNGQLIIGNTSTSSYNVSTLTPSNNILISNNPGSISIATSLTPTFTSVNTGSMTSSTANIGAITSSTVNTGSLTSSAITFTGAANSILTTNGSSLIQGVSLTDGELIIGNSATSSYNTATLTNGSNMNIVSGHGSITVNTSLSPTYNNMTLNQLTGSNTTLVNAQTASSNLTFSLPPNAGGANYLLITDGAGSLTWTNTISVFNATVTNNLLCGAISLKQNIGSNTTTIGALSSGLGTVFNFPGGNGSANYVLGTDGSGNTSWNSPNNVIMGTTAASTGSNNRVTYTSGGLSTNITLRTTSSRVKVTVTATCDASSASGILVTLYRNGSDLAGGIGFANISGVGQCTFSYIDSPASTSAITYDAYFLALGAGAGFVFFGGSLSNIILEEIF